jgi:hypothetical protein
MTTPSFGDLLADLVDHAGDLRDVRFLGLDPQQVGAVLQRNSPSFNWTLNFRQQAYDALVEEGADVSAYDRADLMNVYVGSVMRWWKMPARAEPSFWNERIFSSARRASSVSS